MHGSDVDDCLSSRTQCHTCETNSQKVTFGKFYLTFYCNGADRARFDLLQDVVFGSHRFSAASDGGADDDAMCADGPTRDASCLQVLLCDEQLSHVGLPPADIRDNLVTGF